MNLEEKLAILETTIKSTESVLGGTSAEEKEKILSSVLRVTLTELNLSAENIPRVQDGDIVEVYLDGIGSRRYIIMPAGGEYVRKNVLLEFGEYVEVLPWYNSIAMAIIGAEVGESIEVELRNSDAADINASAGNYVVTIESIEKTRYSNNNNPHREIEQREDRIASNKYRELIKSLRFQNHVAMANHIAFLEEESEKMHDDSLRSRYHRAKGTYKRTRALRDSGRDLRRFMNSDYDD